MRKKVCVIAATFILGILSSCGTMTPVPQDPPTPSETPTAVVHFNAMGSPIPTIDMNSIPTWTPPPPTATPNYTVTAAAELRQTTMQARQAASRQTATLAAAFPGRCNTNAYNSLLSPDGTWLAKECPYEELEVVRRDGEVIWSIPHESMYSDWPNYPNNVGGLQPLHWTPDNRYLFFAQNYCCYDGPGISQDGPLYRLDTTTGEWMKFSDGGYFSNYYSFSPVSALMIHVREFAEPFAITVIDQITGESRDFPLPNFEQAGATVWSPEGKSLAIMLMVGDWWFDNDRYSFAIVDLVSWTQQTIILNSEDIYTPYEWRQDGTLVLDVEDRDFTNHTTTYQFEFYNPETGQFLQALPTP